MADYEVAPPPDRLSDRVQLRTAFGTDRGEVTRFLVQLEYWLEGDWREVVRYDHDCEAPSGHDISEDGLHMDVFRDGEKLRAKRVTGPIPANDGFNAAEEDLRENAEHYVKRFERWHGVKNGSDLLVKRNTSSSPSAFGSTLIGFGRHSMTLLLTTSRDVLPGMG